MFLIVALAAAALQTGGRTPPFLTQRIEPPYTHDACLSKIQGTVVVSGTIEADGTVGAVRVIRDIGYGLAERTTEAVKRWKFIPGRKDGVPAPVQASLEATFRYSPETCALALEVYGTQTRGLTEALAIPRLTDTRAPVKINAAEFLGRKGSAAAEQPLWAAFEYWHRWWMGRSAAIDAENRALELTLVKALLNGAGWTVDAAKARRARSLCLSE